jgi:RNA polymerase sigma factor (sigma-70 family)
MEKLRLKPLDNLLAQLLRGPRRLRLAQLMRCEFLLSVVESGQSYPFDFVCHNLTGYRGGGSDGRDVDLRGEDLIRDLVKLAELLSADANLSAESWPEPLWSLADLGGRLGVSDKTICRWRERGLAGWRFRVEAGGRPRLLFPERSVRRFVGLNATLVARGAGFSQMTKGEREHVLARARDLVHEGHRTPHAVARVVAAETGRAVETIRLILKHFDAAHPEAGLFNSSPPSGGVDDRALAVWEAYMDGARVETLAERFGQPVSWIYHTLTQMRARELRGRKIEFIGSQEFEAPGADDYILHSVPSAPLRVEPPGMARRVPAGLPAYLANLFRLPLLTREGEVVLFRRMNYLKYKARRVIDSLDPETAHAVELDRIEALLDHAARIKNELVQANLRLVVSIAKRHLSQGQGLFELISDGNMSLMRAVDKFDYTRGFKFSTYASWAIMKNFARSVPALYHQRERYQTGWDELLDHTRALPLEETESDYAAAVRGTLDRMLATLEPREQSILRQRFGLDGLGEPQTLEQIGRSLGVSKERIRQLESRAMHKLRGGFEADVKRLLGE